MGKRTATAPASISNAPSSIEQWAVPTLRDIYAARQVVNLYLTPTPLIRPAALAERLGADVYVKLENLQPIGAFKIRGGINLLSQLSPEERERGVVTASTGNHGQSIAYAAREFGVNARVVVPEGANAKKVASMRRLGADVIFYGPDFDTGRVHAEQLANNDGAYYVHAANEPRLIAGVATYSLEILEAVPDLDLIFVPIGGGSGASGACLAGKAINPNLRVIGVQSLGAPAAYETWRRRELVDLDQMETFAEGIATRTAFALPSQILWEHLDDFHLVSDSEIRRAILTLLETTGQLAEGAGAAGLAAAFAHRADVAGKKVGIVLSGGNLTLDALRQAMSEERPW